MVKEVGIFFPQIWRPNIVSASVCVREPRRLRRKSVKTTKCRLASPNALAIGLRTPKPTPNTTWRSLLRWSPWHIGLYIPFSCINSQVAAFWWESMTFAAWTQLAATWPQPVLALPKIPAPGATAGAGMHPAKLHRQRKTQVVWNIQGVLCFFFLLKQIF